MGGTLGINVLISGATNANYRKSRSPNQAGALSQRFVPGHSSQRHASSVEGRSSFPPDGTKRFGESDRCPVRLPYLWCRGERAVRHPRRSADARHRSNLQGHGAEGVVGRTLHVYGNTTREFRAPSAPGK
jgi:hypothetical protein